MPVQRLTLTDFSAGEVSKKFSGRFDLDIYARGCEQLENWVPFTQGGITTRPPLKHLGETQANVAGRLIPFVVGATAFEVELTPLALRIWKGDALQVIAPTNPIVTTYTAEHLNYIQYQKVANQLFLVHRGYPIKVLTWQGAATFTFEDLSIAFGTNVDAWTAATAYEEDDIVIHQASGEPPKAYVCITAGLSGSTGPTTEEDDILDGEVSTGAHWSWQFTKPFSQAGDYPGAVAYFNGRMCFAGTTNDPDTVWMSQPYDFTDFNFFSMYSYTGLQLKDAADWASPEVPETEVITYNRSVIGEGHAIEFQLASENDESVMWLCATEHLVIGTGTSEWIVTKDVTALNLDQCVHLRSRIGSAEQQAMVISENPMFLQGTLAKAFLWEYAYRADQSELDSTDLTYLSDHMLENGVAQMDFVQMPQPMWLGVTNGKLAALLYSKKYKIAAWFTFVTDGTILSVCVVPGTTDDAIYVLVLRNTRYCFERFESIWEDVPLLDSYYSMPAAPATVTGLDRLEAETVWIYNETDNRLTQGVVAAGALAIATADQGDKVWIGLPYTHLMKSMRLSTLSSESGQSGQGQPKRILAVTARVLESLPFKVGYSSTQDLELARNTEDSTWTAAYTGDVRIPFQGRWGREGYLWIVQDLPQRTTILALFPEIDV